MTPLWGLPRFGTDANVGGCEKLSVALPSPGTMRDVPKVPLGEIISTDDLMPPMSIFMVKGWTRAISALTVMACCFEMEDFYQAGPGKAI